MIQTQAVKKHRVKLQEEQKKINDSIQELRQENCMLEGTIIEQNRNIADLRKMAMQLNLSVEQRAMFNQMTYGYTYGENR
jgi:predicted nuclease with TOPRIM domain